MWMEPYTEITEKKKIPESHLGQPVELSEDYAFPDGTRSRGIRGNVYTAPIPPIMPGYTAVVLMGENTFREIPNDKLLR